MTTAASDSGRYGRRAEAREGAHVAGLWGLAARGGLYLVLAVLAIELVLGSSKRKADARGGLHQLAHSGVGSVVLAVLALGFAGFALWHLYTALVVDRHRHDAARALAEGGRAVVYAVLCALAISFLTTDKGSGNSDRTDKTWTARVLHWPAGRVLVGAIGIAIIFGGLYLLRRAITGDAQDEPAVVEAAPRETPSVKLLGRIGNVARGAVLALVGVFLLDATIEYDPNKTVALDGALKRILDQSYGDVLVVLVAGGFAAFGLYSLARAWVNRSQPARRW